MSAENLYVEFKKAWWLKVVIFVLNAIFFIPYWANIQPLIYLHSRILLWFIRRGMTPVSKPSKLKRYRENMERKQ